MDEFVNITITALNARKSETTRRPDSQKGALKGKTVGGKVVAFRRSKNAWPTFFKLAN